MKIHLQKEIDQLKKRLFHLSSLVEENLEQAIRAVVQGDRDLARTVRKGDHEIDLLEVAVEEDCLKILALHQPVAVDLRFLIAVLKMNNDLERIGDLAVNIARGKGCHRGRPLPPALGEAFRELGLLARTMLRDSLDALMNLDAAKAHSILVADDEVDAKYHELSHKLSGSIADDPEEAETMVCWLLAAKSVERVADLATNIAEDTIYTIEGKIIRHRSTEETES
ncbi:phosphate signaling complex protein PhoU [bacterium]|nr:phosphate signaling complex protein PhoU [bacterium]PIV80762.1 MAG: phosphate transport system regulatory protein PhoU [bacterium CG17_big_fil_post_rev_8_21_14_2_50_64_8]PJA74322.1 MAG: phosphate transport system regulatory protein PhoU [bacterium CG_4_9_14_3_um_filter_65_15]